MAEVVEEEQEEEEEKERLGIPIEQGGKIHGGKMSGGRKKNKDID